MAGVVIHRPAGSVLFRPGDACEGFLILKSGSIRVSLTGEAGKEIVLYRVRPGEVCLQTFSCLIAKAPYAAEGVAESDIDAVFVPASEFKTTLLRDEPFRDQLFAAVAARFGDFERLVEDLALKSLDARLAGALLRLTDEEGELHITHNALAAELGSGRAAVTRRLSALSDLGLIAVTRGSIRMLEKEALSALARGPAT